MTTPPVTLPGPALLLTYQDPAEGFSGWFVRHTLDHAICAGGMRVQQGLTADHLVAMAANMTRKMRIAGLRVDGAKCGIAYRPESPGKKAAIARFLTALRPLIETSYSMGPDLNVEMETLETIARSQGMISVKMAIARAQGWDMDYFQTRSALLDLPLDDGWTLQKIRAGYGVAMAVLATLDHLQIPAAGATVALQGFGTLAKATAYALNDRGVRITAIADIDKCRIGAPEDCARFLKAPGTLLPDHDLGDNVSLCRRDAILEQRCDIFIPAAVEHTVTAANCHLLACRAVVPGANLAVTDEAASLLHQRGIPVIPDFVAGCGGSLSMEGLYGPIAHPDPRQVLDHIEQKMTFLIQAILQQSVATGATPQQVALQRCTAPVADHNQPPYGPL